MVVLPVLAGCMPLYLPPVPEPVLPQSTLELTATGVLMTAEDSTPGSRAPAGAGGAAGGTPAAGAGTPGVVVNLRAVAVEGYLAVQWLSPENREVASASVWIDSSMAGETVSLGLPEDVPVTSGRWRAILSFGSSLLRQVSIDVP